MRQTLSRILVMGAALLSSAPAAAAAAGPPDGDPSAPAPVPAPLPPPSSEPVPTPNPAPPPAEGAGLTGSPGGGAGPTGSPDGGPWPRPWLVQPLPDEPFPARPTRRWYGWQILLPGILSDFLGLIGVFTFQPLLVIGVGGHGITGPIVHFAHGQPGKAGASFLLEAVLPLAAVGSTILSSNVCRGDCVASAVIGVISIPVTVIGGMVVDAVALAHEDITLREATSRRPGGPAFSLAPLLVTPLRADQGMTSFWRKGWGREAPIGLSVVGRF